MNYITPPEISRSISTGLMKDLVFIGLGMSNTFSILKFLHQGYKGNRVLVIEQGPSMDDPARKKNILIGAAGAGGFSDGKMVFSTHESTSVVSAYKDIKADHDFIKEMILKFHPAPKSINITQPSETLSDMESAKEGWGDISIAQSETWHLGTVNSQKLFKAMYDYMEEMGVEIKYNFKLVKISPKFSKITYTSTYEYDNYNSKSSQTRVIELKDKIKSLKKQRKDEMKQKIYYNLEDIDKEITSIKYAINNMLPTEMSKTYTKLILGLGKTGKEFIDDYMDKHKIKSKNNVAQIGVRFETLFNDKIKNISKEQYDFKFTKSYPGMKLRTFCVNHYSAYVVEEKLESDIKSQYNGHSFGIKGEDAEKNKNLLSNWGIIAEVDTDYFKELNADVYINKLVRSLQRSMDVEKLKADMEVPRKDRKYTHVTGDDITFIPSLQSKPADKMSKDLFKNSFEDLGENILNFIEELKPILGYGENYKFYIPEIKISSGKIPSEDTFILNDDKKVITLGDISHLQTRGIVPAAVMGIEFANKELKIV